MEKIINTNAFKWLRKSFLNKIYKSIDENKDDFCCHVDCWEGLFICWKELKEVKENMDSSHITVNNRSYNCRSVWFYNKEDRLNFIKQCIRKL